MDDHWLHQHPEIPEHPFTNLLLLACIALLIAVTAGITPIPAP